MVFTEERISELWKIARDKYKIQQIEEEWMWLSKNTVEKWSFADGKERNIIEIGAYDGGSSFYLSRFASKMITIDNNDPCRFDPDTFKQWGGVFQADYEYIAGDSHHPKQTELFSKHEWDFAFIDGDHSYEGVKADFYNLLPHLKKGTPVAFHDIAISDFHHQHGCYVGEFWRDLKKEYNATKFEEFQSNPDWAGIGICWC
jgi:predicted O-methyltransferase YrrM